MLCKSSLDEAFGSLLCLKVPHQQIKSLPPNSVTSRVSVSVSLSVLVLSGRVVHGSFLEDGFVHTSQVLSVTVSIMWNSMCLVDRYNSPNSLSGDLVPTTRASKIFTVFFGMGGIAFLGAAVAAVGGRFVEAEVNAVRTARRQSLQHLMHLFEGMPKVLAHFRRKSEEEQRRELLEKALMSRDDLQRKFRENLRHRIEPFSTSVEKIVQSTLLRSLPSFSVVILGGLIMHRLNGKAWTSWEDAV